MVQKGALFLAPNSCFHPLPHGPRARKWAELGFGASRCSALQRNLRQEDSGHCSRPSPPAILPSGDTRRPAQERPVQRLPPPIPPWPLPPPRARPAPHGRPAWVASPLLPVARAAPQPPPLGCDSSWRRAGRRRCRTRDPEHPRW
jgi:hypothetical protein